MKLFIGDRKTRRKNQRSFNRKRLRHWHKVPYALFPIRLGDHWFWLERPFVYRRLLTAQLPNGKVKDVWGIYLGEPPDDEAYAIGAVPHLIREGPDLFMSPYGKEIEVDFEIEEE